MQRTRIVTTLGGYVGLVAICVPWGEFGGFGSYILVGLVCAVANFRRSQTDPRFRWPFRLIAAFVVAFVVARAMELASLPREAVDVAYQVSYVVVLATVVVMVRLRVQRFELSAFLESTLVSAGVLLVVLQIQLVPGLETDGFVIAAILLTTFLMSLTFLGRSSAGPAWPLWFMTVMLSVALEIAYGFRDTSALAAFLSTHAASLAFLPLTVVTVFDRPIRQTTNDELLVRRPIGRRQLAVTFFLLVLPPAALIPMVSASDRHWATALWVGVCALVITAAVVWRFDLLVRDRDRSFASEERLRALSERIVSVGGRDEVFRTIASTVRELVEVDTPVAFLAVSADEPNEVHVLSEDGFRSIGQTGDAAAALMLLEASQNSPSEECPPSDFSKVISGELVLPYNQRERPELRGNLRTIEAILQLTLETLDVRERSHQERADSRFRALVQDSNDIVMVVDGESGTAEYVGPTLVRLLGRETTEYVGADPLQHLHPDDREVVQAAIGLDHGALEPLDVRIQAKEGDYRWFALSVRDLADESELEGLLYSFADINDRKMAELQLLSSEGRYRTLVKNAKDVFALIDADSRITFVSPNVGSLLGYSPNDLIGTNVRGLLTERGAAALDDVLRRNDSDLLGRTVEVELQTASDEARVVEVVFSDPGLDDEAETLVTVRDITEQRRLEESLRHQTLYDPLTGLFNRASIYPELARGLQGLASTDTIAVLHINVVDFRHLNESVGFGEGDRLLIEIGSRLRSVLRSEDSIARFNADEFAVVTTGPTLGSIFDLGSRLLASFEEPFVVDDRQIEIRAVLGLDASSDRRQNATTLIENAALAMRASRDNDQPITVFEESMRIEATERFELVSDFRAAIDDGQFSLVFQPLFDLDQNKVSSVEALLRWNHPERGLISPAVFIPLAEESGFIVDLGQWVLRQACEQLAEWHENLPNGRGLSMSVNVSARQLESTGSAQSLLDTIEASGVDKSALTLELTETVLIADAQWLRDELELFRELGIKIAVDDFGAGAAGLNHLRDVPFDVLKIDKSYIDNIEHSEESYNLVAGVIELAHGMKTRLVAEGIETPKQASLLRQMGCDYGQGFYLGRPMAPNRLEEWFALGRDGSVAAAISDAR